MKISLYLMINKLNMIHAILIGDIVNSREYKPTLWQPVLEKSLQQYAKTFDIFRGDSFQAELPLATCFEFIFYIKAQIKALGKLDIRIGLGIGEVEYSSKEISNSTGEAFLNAGEAFDTLKKNLIALRSPWREFDEPVQIMLELATELANRWTVNMAESVAIAIAHPDYNQQELTKILNRKHQSQVSTELTKAHYNAIKKVIEYCTQELQKRC